MTGRSTPEWVGSSPDAKVPPRVRQRVFDRYKGTCYLSGILIAGKPWDLEHIKPLHMGGRHAEDNLAPALTDQHAIKTAAEMKRKAKADRAAKAASGAKASAEGQEIKSAGFQSLKPASREPDASTSAAFAVSRGGAMSTYEEFLARKRIADPMTGMVDPGVLPDVMMSHQRDIASWALRRGRAAVFAGTGLGKTLIELTWGAQVAAYTGKPVLIFAPLAVSAQHVREAVKFGLSATIVDALPTEPGVYVTNYQKVDRFDLSRLGGVMLDESSILKSTDGHYRTKLIEDCASIPFRLAATATPAPNDFMELGNHAEFLGVMSYTDMLATFFTHDGGDTQKWRLKGYAEDAFWRWMASWAVMIRKPSDLGYDDAGYDLPPLNQFQHSVGVDYAPSLDTGLLFPVEARTMQERLSARRSSVSERVAMAAQMTPSDRSFVWWCNLNAESEALTKVIPGAVEVRGSDKDTDKEQKLIAFSEGRIRVLVTKASIAGFGMNWQHCADTGFVGLSDSFEQVFQAIRRFWRFGQTKPVNVHFIAAETEGAVVANLRRKESDAERMAAAMVRHMADFSASQVRGAVRDRPDYRPIKPMIIPSWMETAA